MVDNPAGGAGLTIGVDKNHLDLTALKSQVRLGNSKELLMNEDPGIDVSPQDCRLATVFISRHLFLGFPKYLLIVDILPS